MSETSDPSRTMRALPKGTVYSPSGTPPFAVRYSALGSRKITGSGPRIAEVRSPLPSAGVDGITTFRPAVWMKYASGLCEWYRPPLIPPPDGARITTGAGNWPADRYRNFASSDTAHYKAG